LKIRKLSQTSKTEFQALWDDGHAGPISVFQIRDTCPCASCKGETVLLRTYVPPEADKSTPGRYEVRHVEMVGGYAMKFQWGDGHDLGLYTWELLRSLCGCGCQQGK
jgi:DUF971 family protein